MKLFLQAESLYGNLNVFYGIKSLHSYNSSKVKKLWKVIWINQSDGMYLIII